MRHPRTMVMVESLLSRDGSSRFRFQAKCHEYAHNYTGCLSCINQAGKCCQVVQSYLLLLFGTDCSSSRRNAKLLPGQAYTLSFDSRACMDGGTSSIGTSYSFI